MSWNGVCDLILQPCHPPFSYSKVWKSPEQAGVFLGVVLFASRKMMLTAETKYQSRCCRRFFVRHSLCCDLRSCCAHWHILIFEASLLLHKWGLKLHITAGIKAHCSCLLTYRHARNVVDRFGFQGLMNSRWVLRFGSKAWWTYRLVGPYGSLDITARWT